MATQDQRPRFYEGQYLGADDVNAVVEYDHEMIARHELGLHGWGIAVGLTLLEQPTPGAPKRQNVFLTPGMAEDGFGRKIVVLMPAKLPDTLFAKIPFSADVDDPSKNSGTPPGRFVKVWLAYDEQSGKPPGAGFVNCDAGNEYTRVQETYRFLIGDQTNTHRISVAGRTVNATDALKISINPTAPSLPDESVPQQTFPSDNLTARWLIPIGFVRWVVNSGGGGYFVDRNIDANDKGDDRIRKVRHYIGTMTEAINGSDGALVLRNRTDDPNDPNDPIANGRFLARLQSGDPLIDTLRDLVWVEGNLRSVGDIRMAGSALRFADIRGSDQNTPLSIERIGDKPLATGQRSLDALIGPETQTDNRFAVATVVKDDPDPAKRQLSEKLSVLSGGKVGVANDSPAYALHVKGDRIRLEKPDGSRILDLRTDDGNGVTAESHTSDFVLRATGGAPTHNLILNPDPADGNVGIGIANPDPNYKLDVKAKAIKLGLEDNGGGQLVLKNNPGDNKIFLEAFSSDGTANATELLLTGRNGGFLPEIALQANTTYVAGNLGVATETPDQPLTVSGNVHVIGDNIVLENPARTKNILLFTNGADVDIATTTNDLSIRSAGHNCLINWLAGDGNVGIGTGSPQQKLHVGGQFIRIEGNGGEAACIGTGTADVIVGSFNGAVTDVWCWNQGYNGLMNFHCAALHQTSDREAKTNIAPINNALETVERLRGVHFDWKNAPERPAGQKEIGLIAQEVEKVLPQLVAHGRGTATVAYTALVPLLIEAVKELKERNETLAQEVKALKDGSNGETAHKGKQRSGKRG
jgi:hypothetical protein